MDSTDPDLFPSSHATNYEGASHHGLTRNIGDSHLPTLNEEEYADGASLLQEKSLSSMYKANVTTAGSSHDLPSITSSASFADQRNLRSSASKPKERQLSILDPLSDRVSTILVWKNLTVQARPSKREEFFQRLKSYKKYLPKRKCLLSNTSGAITGGLWAVMGPSGSGKSTLLNTLACRLDVNTIVEGEMRLNGAPYDNAELKRIAGYVMQDDLLNGCLTVQETLMYAAQLRLPRAFTEEQRKERVADVMADLVNKRMAQMANIPPSPPWHKQVRILLRRTFKEQFRQSRIIITSLVQTIVIAILIGTVYLKIGNSQKSTTFREPSLFFCAVNQGVFGALMVINSFPVERALTLRERASGTYFASAYFIAKIVAETLIQIPVPIIFASIVYFLIGYQVAVGKFFIFALFMLLCSLAATSLALMVSAICKTTDMSVTVLPLALEITRLFGGFFLAPSRLPTYFVWLDAISYVKYTFVGTALNELSGLKLTCTAAEIAEHSCITTGEYYINDRGYGYISIGGCIGVLLGYIIFCRIVAFLGVRFLKN
ncbi:unnamed protein product [Rotaria magnacalcarata]|uniref:ABC transporter domain-containing protein n=1 Tax=Rotaria magnacalcarata TaxID=392030 RepID=A0A8S2L1E6_9BILA|nr:unnamed protein product [Rotaria magnacalcarata]